MTKYKIDNKIFDTYAEAEQYAIKNSLCTCSIQTIQV